ncbi:MAG: hypothetical protein E5V74_13795 [Mesorhizobium sp.]|nr:MAG: hypothetical protein E5W03_03870 [Mesorhizobium sp.]TIV14371.1 MAG: hypothetical protein E5W02_15900 [Mesorhizobium sp.]TIV63620.1 MAG: hypothetical protein E5V86_18145 [Mesorhizobium sp.]TIW01618.1 MAG: hypothetical protein E5V74_13795 [Mesorhizobium sp.]
MDNVPCNEAKQNAVEVVEACGEWFVHVIENGKDTITNFELEAYALSYAEGQRIRLGIEKIARI